MVNRPQHVDGVLAIGIITFFLCYGFESSLLVEGLGRFVGFPNLQGQELNRFFLRFAILDCLFKQEPANPFSPMGYKHPDLIDRRRIEGDGEINHTDDFFLVDGDIKAREFVVVEFEKDVLFFVRVLEAILFQGDDCRNVFRLHPANGYLVTDVLIIILEVNGASA